MKSFTLVLTLWVTRVKNPSVYLENWHSCCSGGLLEFQVRAFLTWGHSEENPLTTFLLASSKSYSTQRLSQINLVNQSLRELQQSGRDSNFFHLCWNVAFQVPKSLNTNYLLFVLTVFPVRRASRGGKRFGESNGNTRRLPRLHPFSPETIQNDAMGLLLGFTDRKTTGTHTHTHTHIGLWVRRTIDIQSLRRVSYQTVSMPPSEVILQLWSAGMQNIRNTS